MKTMILAAASAVLLLGACSTTEQRVLKPEELTSIKHVCIIQNAKCVRMIWTRLCPKLWQNAALAARL